MIYLYLNPEVKKNGTTAMNTAINEACIENCCLVRGIFLVWEMSIFFAAGQDFPHLQGFPQTVGKSIHGGGNKQDERMGKIGEDRGYDSGR